MVDEAIPRCHCIVMTKIGTCLVVCSSSPDATTSPDMDTPFRANKLAFLLVSLSSELVSHRSDVCTLDIASQRIVCVKGKNANVALVFDRQHKNYHITARIKAVQILNACENNFGEAAADNILVAITRKHQAEMDEVIQNDTAKQQMALGDNTADDGSTVDELRAFERAYVRPLLHLRPYDLLWSRRMVSPTCFTAVLTPPRSLDSNPHSPHNLVLQQLIAPPPAISSLFEHVASLYRDLHLHLFVVNPKNKQEGWSATYAADSDGPCAPEVIFQHSTCLHGPVCRRCSFVGFTNQPLWKEAMGACQHAIDYPSSSPLLFNLAAICPASVLLVQALDTGIDSPCQLLPGSIPSWPSHACLLVYAVSPSGQSSHFPRYQSPFFGTSAGFALDDKGSQKGALGSDKNAGNIKPVGLGAEGANFGVGTAKNGGRGKQRFVPEMGTRLLVLSACTHSSGVLSTETFLDRFPLIACVIACTDATATLIEASMMMSSARSRLATEDKNSSFNSRGDSGLARYLKSARDEYPLLLSLQTDVEAARSRTPVRLEMETDIEEKLPMIDYVGDRKERHGADTGTFSGDETTTEMDTSTDGSEASNSLKKKRQREKWTAKEKKVSRNKKTMVSHQASSSTESLSLSILAPVTPKRHGTALTPITPRNVPPSLPPYDPLAPLAPLTPLSAANAALASPLPVTPVPNRLSLGSQIIEREMEFHANKLTLASPVNAQYHLVHSEAPTPAKRSSPSSLASVSPLVVPPQSLTASPLIPSVDIASRIGRVGVVATVTPLAKAPESSATISGTTTALTTATNSPSSQTTTKRTSVMTATAIATKATTPATTMATITTTPATITSPSISFVSPLLPLPIAPPTAKPLNPPPHSRFRPQKVTGFKVTVGSNATKDELNDTFNTLTKTDTNNDNTPADTDSKEITPVPPTGPKPASLNRYKRPSKGDLLLQRSTSGTLSSEGGSDVDRSVAKTEMGGGDGGMGQQMMRPMPPSSQSLAAASGLLTGVGPIAGTASLLPPKFPEGGRRSQKNPAPNAFDDSRQSLTEGAAVAAKAQILRPRPPRSAPGQPTALSNPNTAHRNTVPAVRRASDSSTPTRDHAHGDDDRDRVWSSTFTTMQLHGGRALPLTAQAAPVKPAKADYTILPPIDHHSVQSPPKPAPVELVPRPPPERTRIGPEDGLNEKTNE